LGFLLSVAATLPGEHRPLVSGAAGGSARFAQATVAVHQQRPGDFRHAKVEERKDEQFIPEYVALIGFAGPGPCGHADIESDGFGRDGLQQVKHVQAKQHRDVHLEPGIGWQDMDVKATPQVLPGQHMIRHHGIEAVGACHGLARLQTAFGDGMISRGVKRGQLLQHKRRALLEVDPQFLPDVSRSLNHPTPHIDRFSVEERARSRRLRGMNIRLTGAHQQVYAVLADDPAGHWLQVFVVEFAIELRARVYDATVNRRTHRDASGPVVGGQRHFQRAHMHVRHRDQAPLAEGAAPPLSVLEADAAQQHAVPKIKFLAVGQDCDRSRIEPVLVGDAPPECEPVGEIDEILVLNHPAGDVGTQPVVAAGEVGPRIVDVIRHRPGGGTPRREVAISQCAQGFANTLLCRIEPLKHQ
jgi:hypothetical protein